MAEQFDRRRFLQWAAGSAALNFMLPWRGASAQQAPVFLNDPFQLGVASGDPFADGFVIWTRLAPDIFDPQALPSRPIEVGWEVALDEGMTQIVRSGKAISRPDRAHAVHVELHALAPDTVFYYRFFAGDAVSRLGRAKTLPLYGAPTERLRFAVASCQHYAQGFFTAYEDMVNLGVELIVHNGDYIYEYDNLATPQVRRQPTPLAKSLTEYRQLYAVYRTDPWLQAAHAHCPWLLTWDDHEVENDYAKIDSWLNTDPRVFAIQRLNAYRAYFEHMPLRMAARPIRGNMHLHRIVHFGDLLQMVLVDGRQYRDPLPCSRPERSRNGGHMSNCDEIFDADRSRFGAEQEFWLNRYMGRAGTTWTNLAQTTLFGGPHQYDEAGERHWYTDGWGGYQAARARILDTVEKNEIENFVVTGGDIHGFYVGDVLRDPENLDTPKVGAEFCATSITTEANQRLYAEWQSLLPDNPQSHLVDGSKHGYLLCDVTHERWVTHLRTVESVFDPSTRFGLMASYVVEPGVPGAKPA